MGSMRRVIIGRVQWGLVPPVYFGLQWFVVSAWPVPYEFLHHTVSDLGWTTCTVERRPGGVLESCSPRHDWFNIGGVVLWAMLAVGGYLLRGLYEGRRRTRWIVGLWATIAAFGAATCLVPGDVDINLHSLLAVPLFLGTIAVLFLSASALRATAPGLAAAAMVTAVVSLLGLVGLVLALGGYGPVGLTERLAAETLYLWGFAFALAGPGRHASRAAATERSDVHQCRADFHRGPGMARCRADRSPSSRHSPPPGALVCPTGFVGAASGCWSVESVVDSWVTRGLTVVG